MPGGKYVNKVSKEIFGSAKPALCFSEPYSINANPRLLGRTFGWQASKPNQVVDVKLHGDHVSAQVMTSVFAQVRPSSLSKEDFLARAGSLPDSIIKDLVDSAQAHTFSTGSFGWYSRSDITMMVAGQELTVMTNFQAVLRGTKPDGTRDEQDSDAESEPDPKRPRHDKDLLLIAEKQSKDGVLCLSDAKSLWESAMDDSRLSEADQKKLQYIMSAYALEEEADVYLQTRLANSDPKATVPDGAIAEHKVSEKFTCVFFSPGSDCCVSLAKILNQASKTLDIALLCLSDDRLSQIIISQHRAGVRVRIVADNEMGNTLETCDLHELQRAGIEIRWDRTKAHMHHKFVVVDEKILVSGSLNWTTGAIRNNYENIVISHCPDLAKKFAAEFNLFWSSFAPGGKGDYLAQNAAFCDNHIALFFPDRHDANFNFLVQEVRSAKATLDVACFLITVRELKAALKDAHCRKVRVRVILDNRQAAVVHKGSHLKELRAAGIEVRTDISEFHMHHKFCIIDGKTLCNGSFNWTRQAEDANLENLIVFRNELALAGCFTEEFEKLWVEFPER